MENEEELYGAGLPILEKLKMLAEWAPLLGRLQTVMDAKTPEEQALAIVRVLQWAAGKSSTELDDEALFHLEALLKSAEGKAFFGWIVQKVQGA